MNFINNPSKPSKLHQPGKSTLDMQHSHKLEQFTEKEKILESLKGELRSLRTKYEELREKKNTSETVILEMIDLKDKTLTLERELKSYESDDEIEYLINNGDILFQYYDIIDKGVKQDDTHLLLNKAKGENNILKYLMQPHDKKEPNVDNNTNKDRASLLEKYMASTMPNYVKFIKAENKDKCNFCNSSNMNIMLNDGLIFCNDCHTVEYVIVDHDKPSYKQPPPDVVYFSYKRINHFNEWISQIQGKETTDIPDEVYDNILLEIKKQKITNMADLTRAKVKEILKKLKINKYYEHVPHIINKLNGLPSPHFDPELEEKLRSMFKQIQPLFLKHSPTLRKNFLSYSYIIIKFLQLLGKDEYIPYLSLLKSREKLHQQEIVWKKICEELHWEFYRSI